jgi:amino acid adenylation domain-containing protein
MADAAPISYAQERLWLVQQMAGHTTVYVIRRSFWIDGPLDVAALERAIRQVAARQDVLRSRVVTRDEGPVAVLAPPESIRLDRIDLRGAPDARERAVRLAGEYRDPGDPPGGPLLRCLAVQVDDEGFLFHYAVHHIVFDGPSRVIFEREVATVYGAIVAGEPPAGPPLPTRYADFAAAQRAAGGGDADGLAYWVDRLRDAPGVLDGLADHRRPVAPSASASQAFFTVGPDTCERLRRLAVAERTSVFVVTLAAYQFLLGAAAGVPDVVVGVPFAGRPDPELESVIGLFTNTVALRTDLSGSPSLRELVRRVRERVFEALEYQDVPFDQVVDALGVTRDPTVNPLFQHSFAYADGDLAESTLALPGLACRPVELPITTTHFDTEMELRLAGGRIEGTVVYATELFEPATVERLAGRFQRLLAVASRAPDERLNALDLLADRERAELLGLAASDRACGPLDTPLVVRFEEQVTRSPDAVAVGAGESALTYRELYSAAAALAERLMLAGVRPGGLVGIRLPRGSRLVVALLATVMAGAAYLPLDPGAPDERVAFQLEDSGAEVLLTTGAYSDATAPEVTVLVDDVDDGDEPSVTSPRSWTATGETAELLYVIYTSGSTGRPKGVAVSHRQFGSLVRWHLETYSTGPRDRVAQVAGASFDAAGWEIWPALLSGARLEICPDEIVRSPDRLVCWLAEREITQMFAPTPLAEQLLRYPLGERTKLRLLLTGGDVFRPRDCDDPGIGVVNHYGPTENAVVATATTELTAPWRNNSIGRPIGDTRVYLLDGDLRLVPRGAVGEIFLAGPAVAWGYWRRPRLTAERFVPDPFSAVPGARLYRTGDLARWTEEGTLRYLGRADTQLSLRGYRIEPAEVEAALRDHRAVRDAVVTAATTRSGERVLAAYLVARQPVGRQPDLRAFLATKLPHHMVPQVFIELPELPQTTSGKLDRRRLSGTVLDDPPDAEPRTDAERTMARLWGEVLGVEGVSVFADFFALGGNSMSAARLLNRINNAFAIDFPLRGIFDHPTLAELSNAVAEWTHR